MERITISLDAELAAEFDRLIAERDVRHGYRSAGSGHGHVHLKPKT